MRGRRFHTAWIVHSICRGRSLFQLDEKRHPADWAPTTPAQPKDNVSRQLDFGCHSDR